MSLYFGFIAIKNYLLVERDHFSQRLKNLYYTYYSIRISDAVLFEQYPVSINNVYMVTHGTKVQRVKGQNTRILEPLVWNLHDYEFLTHPSGPRPILYH